MSSLVFCSLRVPAMSQTMFQNVFKNRIREERASSRAIGFVLRRVPVPCDLRRGR